MKVGVQILVYNQEDYLKYFLESIYPFVDVIQVMYSEQPFIKYNKRSRADFYRVDSSLDILTSFDDPETKISVQKGVWDDEELMRDDAVIILREKGVDLMLIIDVDEFWPDGLLPDLTNYLKSNLKYDDVAWAHYKTLFKRFDRMIDFSGSKLPVACLLNENTSFKNGRIPSGNKYVLPNHFFYWHFGYVMDDDRMYEKIHTFSHAHEIPNNWFEDKWLNFSNETKNLCRKGTDKWPRTIPVDYRSIPSVLHHHPLFLAMKR